MKLSYVMPAHNKEPYIAEAIESFLGQRYKKRELVIPFKNQELIIIDDNSKDATKSVCEWYQAKHKNIHYYKTSKNEGVANCRNMGRQFARGEIICVLDADDISYPNRSETIAKLFGQNPKLDCMYSAANVIDVTGKTLARREAQDFHLSRIKNENYIVHSTVAFRNKIKTRYRDNLKFIDDWYFYIDCYNAGHRFGHVENVLSAWRITPEGLTYKDGMKSKGKEKLKKALINEFKDYDEDLSRAMQTPQQKIRIQQILKEIPKRSRVLDVGCNAGYLLTWLDGKGCKAIGVEVATNLRSICESRGFTIYKHLSEVEGRFDRIVFADILEHYDKPAIQEMLLKASLLLNKSGKIVITVPYKHSFYSSQFDEHHVADYDPKDFQEMFPRWTMESRGVFFNKQAIPVWHLIVMTP